MWGNFGCFTFGGLSGKTSRSETAFRPFSNSVFKSKQEYGSLNNSSWHKTWKIQFYKKWRKIKFFRFFEWKEASKNSGTHIHARLEILYRMVYKTSK